jgi:hypothetical protein
MDRHLMHINIPKAIYEAIQELAVTNGMYRGVPEFVLECTRNRIFELRNQKIARQRINIYFKKQNQKKEQAPAQISQS